MSYFSDLAIDIAGHDKSYPAPEVQLQWRLEDLIRDALSYGITQTEIESLFNVPKGPVLAADNELLYSYNSSYSITLVMRCIKIALAKLSQYRSIVGEDSANRIEYYDSFGPQNTLLCLGTGKAA